MNGQLNNSAWRKITPSRVHTFKNKDGSKTKITLPALKLTAFVSTTPTKG